MSRSLHMTLILLRLEQIRRKIEANHERKESHD